MLTEPIDVVLAVISMSAIAKLSEETCRAIISTTCRAPWDVATVSPPLSNALQLHFRGVISNHSELFILLISATVTLGIAAYLQHKNKIDAAINFKCSNL